MLQGGFFYRVVARTREMMMARTGTEGTKWWWPRNQAGRRLLEHVQGAHARWPQIKS